MKQPGFIPLSRREMLAAGWDGIDVLLITGDAYVDHPSYGVAIIGRLLIEHGFRVGLVAQPDWKNPEVLKEFGTPELGIGVSSGNMDSMLNIYTAGRRLRHGDVYSEDGQSGLRPPHALNVYVQLVKRAFPGIPVAAGGLEASLRRIAHYDYWQDKLRRSALVDSKADILQFGMGERSTLEIYRRLRKRLELSNIPGTCRFLGAKESAAFDPADKYRELPSFEEISADPVKLLKQTIIIESEMNPACAHGLFQRYGDRILLLEPPAAALSTEEMDQVYSLPFANKPHPRYKKPIPAFETIKNSIPAVRGCPGGCSFCGLVAHQGRGISSRSEESIINSVNEMLTQDNFRGTISDIGGAAGNIYMSGPRNPEKCSNCRRVSCLFPKPCPNYQADGRRLLQLLRKVRNINGVKHLHINSGIRLDLANRQKELMREIVRYHVSGHLKVAPEHLDDEVLKLMRKNPSSDFYEFMEFFKRESNAASKEQYLIPLFISNFPGCSAAQMRKVDEFLDRHNWSPQQVQDFIPLPMTMAAAMYYCGRTPNGRNIQVNRGLRERRTQIKMLKKKRSRR